MSICFSFAPPVSRHSYEYLDIEIGFTVKYGVRGKSRKIGAGRAASYRPGVRSTRLHSSVIGMSRIPRCILDTTRSPLECREVLVKEHIAMRRSVETSARTQGVTLTVVDSEGRQDLTGGLSFLCSTASKALSDGTGGALLHLAVGLPFLYMARTDRPTLKRLRNFDITTHMDSKRRGRVTRLDYNGILSSRMMASAELSCSLLAGLGRAALKNYVYMTSKERCIIDKWSEEAFDALSSANIKAAKVLLDKAIYFLAGASNWNPNTKSNSYLPFSPFTRTALNLEWACAAIFAPLTQSTSLISMKAPRPKKKSYSSGFLSLRAHVQMEERAALNNGFLHANASALGISVSKTSSGL